MNRRLAGAGLILLAGWLGCDRMISPVRHPIYAPWEEGLTLVYEEPRSHERMQVRVQQSKPDGAGMAVTTTFTTLTSNLEARFRLEDGGVVLDAGGSGGLRLLPAGFPERAGRWTARDRFYWVVGRGTADLPGVRFPDDQAAEGVWVESCAADGLGPRQRVLYLPDVGEAETLEWRDGRWVVNNRLVQRGFTDLPRSTQETPAGSNP
jgi:hypothetical protein